MYYWEDRLEEALKYTQAAQALPANGTSRGRAICLHGRVLGRQGRLREATETLSEAHRHRESRDVLDPLPGVFAFPVQKELYWAASAYEFSSETSYNQQGQQAAEEAIGFYEASAPGEVRIGELSLARLELAAARWRNGVLDGASAAVEVVFNDLQHRRVESVCRRLERLAQGLGLRTADKCPEQSALRERIREYLVAPKASKTTARRRRSRKI